MKQITTTKAGWMPISNFSGTIFWLFTSIVRQRFFFKDHGLGCPLWQLTYRAQSEKHSEGAENPTSAAHLPPPHFVCRQERDLLANWY